MAPPGADVRGLAGRWRAVPGAWRRAVVAVVVLRLGVGVLGVLVPAVLPVLEPYTVAEGAARFVTAVERFDALWYLEIAQQGYPVSADGVPQAVAFFPGFPALTAVLAVVIGSALAAGSILALVAAVAAVAGIHRLAEDLTGDAVVGRAAQVALAVFPTAFFLVAPFTESLFAAASTWALVWAGRRQWAPAAAAGVLAGLTRGVGALLVIPLAVGAWRHRDLGRGLLAAAGGPAGVAIWFAVAWWRWGSPLAPLSAQSGWQREPTWPWETVWTAADFGLTDLGVNGYHTLDVIVVAPVLIAVVWLLWRRYWGLGLYAAGHVLVWLVLPFPSRPLLSAPRFALAVAPVFAAFGAWTAHRRGVATVWTAISAALLGLHLALFLTWRHVF